MLVRVMQRGDALDLVQTLPESRTPLSIFDPQHRSVLNRQKYGNEGRGRQKARIALPANRTDARAVRLFDVVE
jgi:hypothetical protein